MCENNLIGELFMFCIPTSSSVINQAMQSQKMFSIYIAKSNVSGTNVMAAYR